MDTTIKTEDGKDDCAVMMMMMEPPVCPPVTPLQFAYRAGLTLNNLAATMMARSCYEQALDTVKDAVVVMNSSISPGQEMSREDINERLESANHRITNPDVSLYYIPLNVISHDARLNSVEFLLWTSPAHLTHSLIRVESNEFDLFFQQDSHNLPSAIILYNFAVASLCQAKTADPASVNQVAVTLLTLSRSLHSMLIQTSDDPFVMPRVLFILAILLQTLIPTLHACGLGGAATCCTLELTGLQRVAGGLGYIERLQASTSAPAA